MASDPDGDRAARLLRTMHRVFSHDLPNQVVALQSLLQMLETEQHDRLGPEGRDCLRRLQRVAGKTAGLANFLREVGRLHSYERRTELIDLRLLLHQVAEAQRPHAADAAIECRLAGPPPSVVGDPRLLAAAAAEVVGLLIEREPGGRWVLELHGRPGPAAVALEIELARPAGAPRPAGAAPPPAAVDDRLELLVAREWLAAWGARLGPIHAAAEGGRFTIDVPTPARHG